MHFVDWKENVFDLATQKSMEYGKKFDSGEIITLTVLATLARQSTVKVKEINRFSGF